jgi:dTDP-4-dehydrorhamnose reductase
MGHSNTSRILCIGKNGQLAHAVSQAAMASELDFAALGRVEADLLTPGAIGAAIGTYRPDVIINTAAYTAVDKAESEPEVANRLNYLAVDEIAMAASKCGARLIHVSTDYVFSGQKTSPYEEGDPTDPQGVYGRTKRDGETAALKYAPDACVVRTSWVYSEHGHNFVKTMLRLAKSRDVISVVDDQTGNPSYAIDLADGLLAMINQQGPGGIYHLTGLGSTTWAGLAREVLNTSAVMGGPSAEVVPISTAEYPTPAKRPQNSCLVTSRISQTYGVSCPPWQDGVKRCLEHLKQEAWELS